MKLRPTVLILSGTYYAPSSKLSGCDLAFVVTGVVESLFPATNSHADVKFEELKLATGRDFPHETICAGSCERNVRHIPRTILIIQMANANFART